MIQLEKVGCRDLDPAELLLVGIVKMAVRDANQDKDPRLKCEAMRWLWVTAPKVAQMAELPRVDMVKLVDGNA